MPFSNENPKWSTTQVISLLFLGIGCLILFCVGLIYVLNSEGILTFTFTEREIPTETQFAKSPMSLPPTWTAIESSPYYSSPLEINSPDENFLPNDDLIFEDNFLANYHQESSKFGESSLDGFINIQPLAQGTDDVYLVYYHLFVFDEDKYAQGFYDGLSTRESLLEYLDWFWGGGESFLLIDYNSDLNVETSVIIVEIRDSNFPEIAVSIITKTKNLVLIVSTLSSSLYETSPVRAYQQAADFSLNFFENIQP